MTVLIPSSLINPNPRYAGLIGLRIGFALMYASLIGWLLVLGWILVVRRRFFLEESHLQKLYGAKYAAYSRRVGRPAPRLY
jgi:protein-S-isoprenylcysteine O-methyltransferase Ste14